MYLYVNNTPWPSAVTNSWEKDQFNVIKTAAAGALLVALVDHGIVRIMRSRSRRQERALAQSLPEIIRRPLFDFDYDEGVTSNDDAGSSEQELFSDEGVAP
jgi:hypothetical protein